MNILSIDTSTDRLSLAVLKGQNIAASINIEIDKSLSDVIIDKIKLVLSKAKVPLEKVDGFIVGLGPGSFTSLRVGLSTIKGLVFSKRNFLVGIPSLDALALGSHNGKIHICVIQDARRGLVYTCFYQNKNSNLKRKGKYQLISVKDALKKLKGDVHFTGNAINLYKDLIKNTKGIRATFASKRFWYPQAEDLISLGIGRFEDNKLDNINKLIPLYLYPEDCQVRQ